MPFRLRQIIPLAIILGIALVVFYPAAHFSFSNWDDPLHITDNPVVKGFSWSTIEKVFLPSPKYMYHPVTVLSFGIQYALWGNDGSAFHIANIILHLMNVVMLFLIIQHLFRSNALTFVVTAIFAFHPMNVEPVVWISSRKDLLCTFFYLFSIFSYVSIPRERRIYRLAAVYGSFAIALLSKPMALSLPVVLLLIDWVRGTRISLRSVRSLLPMVLIALIFGLISVKLSLETEGAVSQITSYTFFQRVCISCYGLLWYPFHTFYPAGLSTVYGYPALTEYMLSWEYYIAPFIVLTFALLIYYYRKNRLLVFGVLFYCATIVLVLQIVPTNAVSFLGDRYHYLPMIGVLIAGYGILASLAPRITMHDEFLAWLARGMGAILAMVLILLSLNRVLVWKSNRTIFEDALRSDHPPLAAVVNCAASYIEEKEYLRAVELTSVSLQQHSKNVRLYFNRGLGYIGLHKYDSAAADFTSAIAYGMQTAGTFYNLGVSLSQKELNDSAVAAFQSAIRIDSGYYDAYYNIGYLYSRTYQRYSAALPYFSKVIAAQPNNVSAFLQRGYAYLAEGNLGKSLQDYVAAVVLLDSIKTDVEIKDLNTRLGRTVSRLDSLSTGLYPAQQLTNMLAERIRLKLELGDSIGTRSDQQYILKNTRHAGI